MCTGSCPVVIGCHPFCHRFFLRSQQRFQTGFFCSLTGKQHCLSQKPVFIYRIDHKRQIQKLFHLGRRLLPDLLFGFASAELLAVFQKNLCPVSLFYTFFVLKLQLSCLGRCKKPHNKQHCKSGGISFIISLQRKVRFCK